MISLPESKLQRLIDSLRPGQKSLANWRGGKMAIAAVPGAGKSHSLSVAAALTIAREQLNQQRQLLIVTYTRSAAASIRQKIRQCLQELGLPQGGFSVQTLHGLALNIATRHPELHQIDFETATIIGVNNKNHQLMRDAAEQWIRENPELYQRLVAGNNLDSEATETLRRQSVLRTEVLPELAYTVIREAKSSGLAPENLAELSKKSDDQYKILEIAAGLYQQYQRLMRTANFIDYDDMILAALQVLEVEQIRKVWQQEVYAVFEDEAQDSSPLQERLISTLAEDPEYPPQVNLVRVGDPNQAINSTFTTADPVYFRWFCEDCQQQQRFATMNQAGRSSHFIIETANLALAKMNKDYLNNYGNQRDLPFRPQTIVPVAADDPQIDANPSPEGLGVEICFPESINETATLIGDRLIKLFKKNPQHNAAILVRENRQGSFLAQQLAYLESEHKIRVYEVNETQRHTQIPREILKLLCFLQRPHSSDRLKEALEILEQRQLIPKEDFNALAAYPEQFLYPTPLIPPQSPEIASYCRQLLKAKLELPHHQLIPFLGTILEYTGSELATLQKLSEEVSQQIRDNYSLENGITLLKDIINNSRKFEVIEEEQEEKYTRPGQLTIITMHKAKGLDWDYVFIPFLHQDSIPGKLRPSKPADFLGDFTLAEVARAQLRNAIHANYKNEPIKILTPKDAWLEAQKLKTAEEFRLFYVALTRGKRLVWLSAEKLAPFSWSSFAKHSKNTKLNNKQASVAIDQLLQHKQEII